MRSREEINSFLKEIRKTEMPITARARRFAEFAHDGQVDKAGKDYMGHILRVANTTSKRYEDDFLTAIALMHDTIEDGGFSLMDLMMFFPPVVWKIVDLLTRKKSEDRAVYINRISENLLAIKVKLADLEDNMNLDRIPNPSPKDYERQDRYSAEYRQLFDMMIHYEKTIPENERETEAYAEMYMCD